MSLYIGAVYCVHMFDTKGEYNEHNSENGFDYTDGFNDSRRVILRRANVRRVADKFTLLISFDAHDEYPRLEQWEC